MDASQVGLGMHDSQTARLVPARFPDDRAILEVRGLNKRYLGSSVLRDLSFETMQGECLALLGPSGAGKTTLIRCMAGLDAPDAGQIFFNGTRVGELGGAQRRRIAVVFQQFNLIGRLSALDNVLAGRLGHVPAWRGLLRRFSREDRLLALECLDRVGLLSLAQQRADTLSGGQQQRVAIARALAQRPDIILADEPVASLDPQSGANVLALLHDICRNDGVTVICSLHQLDFARSWADRILGMAAGNIEVDVAAKDFDRHVSLRIYGSGIPKPAAAI
ncbi:phosphonate transport system ATP-binding protein [Ralstonia pickettii]|jgi:phosphonate transport system ATP-binding protein|uniref:Phosphate-import ATP-binding protein PhnC n=2 Tax=Ralstonia TaxID=48736 RepID=A0ABM9JHF6_9RALS|nr:phosphonate ABC transporter ATP-binding protein [Ralstonia pickettii]MDH6641364.1 phosphonate transport system ATP-binding protein [Ralstonia sp. GP73]CAJ0794035.1 Phosphate-import ATP-binding protein PhnC [Ralstonia sp. LMG 18095]